MASTKKREKPEAAERMLVDRLRLSQFVTEDSITSVANAWIAYEAPQTGRMSPTKYAETRRFITTVSAYTYGRPILEGRLLALSAQIAYWNNDFRMQEEQSAGALKVVEPLYQNVALDLIGNRFNLAQSLVSQNKLQTADRAYMDVLEFPWWTVRSYPGWESFVDYYTRAGQALIFLRKGDPKALKELHFTPGIGLDLNPILNRAIAEAEKKTQQKQ